MQIRYVVYACETETERDVVVVVVGGYDVFLKATCQQRFHSERIFRDLWNVIRSDRVDSDDATWAASATVGPCAANGYGDEYGERVF